METWKKCEPQKGCQGPAGMGQMASSTGLPPAISCHPSSHRPQSIQASQALKVGINASLKEESPMDAERVRVGAWHPLQWKRIAGKQASLGLEAAYV